MNSTLEHDRARHVQRFSIRVVGQFQSERRLFSEDEGTIHEVTRKKRVFRDASCDFVDRVPTIETREPQNDPLPSPD